MKSPKRNEIVEVIDNKTGKSLGKGRLTGYTRKTITIEQEFDAKVVHFKGYEPKKKLVKKD